MRMRLTRYQAATLIAGIGAVALVALYAIGSPELRATMEARIEWLLGLMLPFVQARLTRDSDGDGIPDDLDDTPHGSDPPPPAAGAVGPALLVLALALSAAAQGCGGGAQQHRTLTVITDVADPTYAAAVQGCDVARDHVIAREGTTYAEDRADMDAVHLVCDSIVEGFELLRGSQLTARAAIDAGLSGAAQAAVVEALAAWGRLQGLVPRLMRLTSGGEP